MIRVLVVDDHALVRRGLSDLLSAVEGIEVVGAIADGSLAAEVVTELEPDIVLMDLSMPGLDGIDATRAVLEVRPATKVIILTSFSENARILAALEAGAVGYLLKDAEPEDIIRALRDAAAGGVPLSPKAARALLPGNRPAGQGQRGRALGARARGSVARRGRPAEQEHRPAADHQREDRQGAPDARLHRPGRQRPHLGRIVGAAAWRRLGAKSCPCTHRAQRGELNTTSPDLSGALPPAYQGAQPASAQRLCHWS